MFHVVYIAFPVHLFFIKRLFSPVFIYHSFRPSNFSLTVFRKWVYDMSFTGTEIAC